MKRRFAAVLLSSALSTGCYTTVIRSGLPAGRSPAGYESHWHHGFLFGLADATGSYDIRGLCPQGWSEIRTERDFVTGLLTVLTVWVYTPETVTIVCAESARSQVSHPPAEGPLPPARLPEPGRDP